jgi:hypothetical protein
MANAYVVAAGNESERLDDESESESEDPLSNRLHRLSLAPAQSREQLPRELWTEVLRHTAASFCVDCETVMAYSFADPEDEDGARLRGIAGLTLRYEFRLEPRLGGPRVLRARFTRCVCPWFKTRDERWLDLDAAQQRAVEHHLAREEIFAPFEELRVQLPDDLDSFNYYSRTAQFVFVRRQDSSNQPRLTELSPDWSRICRRELVRVRDQLHTKFHMTLRDQNGAPIQPPRELWD